MSTDFQNKHSSFLKKLVFLFHFIHSGVVFVCFSIIKNTGKIICQRRGELNPLHVFIFHTITI